MLDILRQTLAILSSSERLGLLRRAQRMAGMLKDNLLISRLRTEITAMDMHLVLMKKPRAMDTLSLAVKDLRQAIITTLHMAPPDAITTLSRLL